MYANFMTEFLPEGQSEPVTDLQIIAKRYLHGDFFTHFIPLIPFTDFMRTNQITRLLYLVKVYRLYSVLKWLDVSVLFVSIKDKIKQNTLNLIKTDPFIGEDTSQDHNKVEFLLLVKYILRTIKLVLIILNFSYFIGQIWLMICDIIKDLTVYSYKKKAEA